MIDWMWPGVVASGAIGLHYLLFRPFAPTRRVLPEISVLLCLVLAVAMGLAPLDPTRAALWASAGWRSALFGPLVLAVAWTRLRPVATAPSHAGEAVALGLLLGALPAAALVAPRAHDPAHAARLAVLATAASAISPVGGPAQVLLADASFASWAAFPALAVAIVAWPWRDRPSLSGVSWRLALPGLLGIPVGWLAGGLAGVGAYAAGALAAPPLSDPAPESLAWGRPIRLALAAFVVAALLHVFGVPWGAGWMVDLGDRVPVLPAAVVGVAALPALIVDPFAAAAIADRIVAQPSAPPDLARLIALPLVLCPAPALGVAAVAQGWRALLVGVPLTLAAAGVAVAWVALTG